MGSIGGGGGLDIGREQSVAVFRSKRLVIGKAAAVAPPSAIEEKPNAEDEDSGNNGSAGEGNELVRRRFR